MKTIITNSQIKNLKAKRRFLFFIYVLLTFSLTAQEDIETEDGNLIVTRINAQASVQIATTGANADAVVKVGDAGLANKATLGWDGGDEMFKISTGATLNNNGFMMQGTGGDTRFGLGTQPDANAKVFINYNSDGGVTPTPHLTLRENNNTDYARLQFSNFGADGYWHIAAQTIPADPRMNFYFHNGTTGQNVLVIDGDNSLVGIGMTPTLHALQVNGNASKAAAGDWLANSDRRIKTDIRDIEGSYTTLLKLRPVKFKYTEEWKRGRPSIEDKYYYNFIAQEYAEVFPESVQGSGEFLEGDDKEIIQIDTYNAQIVTIAATQELIRDNTKMKEEIAGLKQALESISTSNAHLSSELQSIKAMLTGQTTNNNSDD